MPGVPLLSSSQWNAILPLLPPNRRNVQIISALLYLEHSGESLRHVCEQFRTTKSRLNQWHRALASDGTLANIMLRLRLESAGPLVRRAGGQRWYGDNATLAAEITSIRVGRFRDALRRRR
jgi:transposase